MVFRPLEIYTTAAFVYFVPIFLCSMASRKLESILTDQIGSVSR